MVSSRFNYIKPSEASIDSREVMRTLFAGLAEEVDALLVDGREKSLAITKLEEAFMWTNRAIELAYGGENG